MKFEVKTYGDKAVLVEFKEHKPHQMLSSLKQLFPEAEIRAGLESVLISFQNPNDYCNEVAAKLADLKPEQLLQQAKGLTITVEYNGSDLNEVARALKISEDKVISIHQNITWSVALIGFAPGFPYLVPDKPTLLDKVARLASPRSKVPAGSVAIAAGMSCIYPRDMPGGWHLIGTTSVDLFDVNNLKQPTLLSVGNTVRFTSK